MHLHRRGDQTRTPRLAGDAADDQVRPRILGRQPEQRQRRIRRQPGVGGKDRRCARSFSHDGHRQRACDSTAPKASAASGTKPASRASRASTRWVRAHVSLEASARSSARGRPSLASASAARNACNDVVVSRRKRSRRRPLPHLDARRAAQVEVDQPRAAAHGEQRRHGGAGRAPQAPANGGAGGEIQRASTGDEIAIEHQHAACSLQTEGPRADRAIAACFARRASPERRSFFSIECSANAAVFDVR